MMNGKELKNGVYKEYYMSGKLKHELPFKDGCIDGVEKYYYENGKLEMETIYSKGKVIKTKKYYENGAEEK